MPDLSSKFTDNNLKLYYGNLLSHYQEIIGRAPLPDSNQIYNELFIATQYVLEHPQGSLYHLDRIEKNKVYDVFNILFRALPLYGQMSTQDKEQFKPSLPQYRSEIYVIGNYRHYDCNNSILYNWLLLNSLTQRCCQSGSNVIIVPSSDRAGAIHSHNSEKSRKDIGQLIALLVIIALAAAAAALTFIAFYYMLNQFLNGVERLWYNEGWLNATMLLASSVVFGSLSALFAVTVASTPLIALAVAAGINPIGVVAAGAICITMLGAGLACFLTSILCGHFEKIAYKDSMDPEDPLRFRLTQLEEHDLLNKNIDPLAVKCAMVALRGEISKVLDSDQTIPSFLSRKFGYGDKVQLLLQQVRGLRNGTVTDIEVGGLTFYCKKDSYYFLPIPSAPIMDEGIDPIYNSAYSLCT